MQNTTHLVVGGGGGIGRAVVASIEAQGGRAIAAGRTLDALKQTAATSHVQLDATNESAVKALFADFKRTATTIHSVINCVGSLLLKPLHQTSLDEFESTYHTNVRSSFLLAREAVKLMRSEGGSIVLLASAASRTGLANHEAISSAKAAIIGLAQSAAATYARYGIRINAVAPGLTDTPLTKHLTQDDLSLKVSNAMHVLGRIGQPDDIAKAILWLIDPSNTWTTGQVIGVDGGLATLRPQPKV